MTPLKISVIIPTRRRLSKLINAIESVNKQSRKADELIVVVDDFEVNYDLIRHDILHLYPDTHVIKNTRKPGANGARNSGIFHSTGELIFFLDDDDEFLINRLELIESSAKEYPKHDFFISDYIFLEKSGECDNVSIKNELNLQNHLRGRVRTCAGSNLVIRRRVVNNFIVWNEDLLRHQDTEYLIRLFLFFNAMHIAEPLSKIYGHNGMPQPAETIAQKKILLNIVDKYSFKISDPSSYKYFVARTHRDIAILYKKIGLYDSFLHHLKISLQTKILPIYKYARLFL